MGIPTNIIWTLQYASNIPMNDEQDLQGYNWQEPHSLLEQCHNILRDLRTTFEDPRKGVQ